MKTLSDIFGDAPTMQKLPQERCSDREAWYCLRTHSKQEHIAAAQLTQAADIEVFLPRIRFKRATRLGCAWVTEALFQNYLFARFDLELALRQVQHSRGVRCVVHFGDRWPTISDEVIGDLRRLMNGLDLRVIEETLQPGDPVRLIGGAIDGLQAVVTRVMPAKQRVAVLLDFLGRQSPLELNRDQIITQAQVRCATRLPSWQAGALSL
jgi:transcriptional antiterminator RfaH